MKGLRKRLREGGVNGWCQIFLGGTGRQLQGERRAVLSNEKVYFFLNYFS